MRSGPPRGQQGGASCPKVDAIPPRMKERRAASQYCLQGNFIGAERRRQEPRARAGATQTSRPVD
jgi:hypothetical protein